jgi:hypothetical protein
MRQIFDLWHEEDIARRDDLPAERIRMAKRTIDRINQRRNDFIELIDSELQDFLNPAQSGCPQHSETPGMIIDRLSILALKESRRVFSRFEKTALNYAGMLKMAFIHRYLRLATE